MSTKREGLLTASGEWAKHLRRWGKRTFWKAERKAANKAAHRAVNQEEQRTRAAD